MGLLWSFVVLLLFFLKLAHTLDLPGSSARLASLAQRALSRRGLCGILTLPVAASAAETVGKDPDCDDAACLGVWDGLLADCPHNFFGGAGCVSSQDDTPSVFAEPWDYSDSTDDITVEADVMDRIIVALLSVSKKRGDDVQILFRQGRYLRARFVDGRSHELSIGEFYVTPNDSTVQFRIASQSSSQLGSLGNRERSELIRKELKFLKLPVLRNRKRSLFFVESDFDQFGPGSAALGPPAEMKTGELEGRQDVDPKLKIDMLQQFPRQ